IDIGAPLGAPIYAASSGSVLYAGPAEGFGNEVILSHAGGVQTVYGHMERILVTAGQAVTAGQPIALVGAEGDATGPHLHFEIWPDGWHASETSQPIDPLPQLQAWAANLKPR
ncbi:MAG TPA: M23 family metallopeptidase, partial [Solirubrobacteraceae bacterium]